MWVGGQISRQEVPSSSVVPQAVQIPSEGFRKTLLLGSLMKNFPTLVSWWTECVLSASVVMAHGTEGQPFRDSAIRVTKGPFHHHRIECRPFAPLSLGGRS